MFPQRTQYGGETPRRSSGCFSTRIHLKTDKKGLPIGFHLTGGEAHDSHCLETLLDTGPMLCHARQWPIGVTMWLLTVTQRASTAFAPSYPIAPAPRAGLLFRRSRRIFSSKPRLNFHGFHN
jgi:hypothetical protein